MKNNRTDTERLIPLKEAPNFLPKRSGKKVHYSTLYRWATKGARGRILETVMVGGVRFTSIEAINRFIGGPAALSPRPSDDLVDAIEEALNKAGL